MSNVDLNAWKNLLGHLNATVVENNAVIKEISDEVELQRRRNRQEILTKASQVQAQLDVLMKLRNNVRSDAALLLSEEDKKAMDHYIASLSDRIEKSQELVQTAMKLVNESQPLDVITPAELAGEPALVSDIATVSDYELPKAEKAVRISRSSRHRPQTYMPKLFRKEYLIGNWIASFKDPKFFTCQSFWDNDLFREYNFSDGNLVQTKEGSFEVLPEKVILKYDDGTQREYAVTGFGDNSIEYTVEDQPITFEFLSEEELNSYLNAGNENAE